MQPQVVREGDVIDGKYRIERIIGAGGMGMVAAAHHLQLDDTVAIKILLPAAAKSRDSVERFSREARALIRIKSEHVTRVMDVGALPNGLPYMVMEYLRGSDLSSVVELSVGPLPVSDVILYVLQACEAIADAHVKGIVHRDLKPANLFLTTSSDGSPCIKVLDFGISRVDGAGMRMTKTAALMGSPLYMSPEQLKSAHHVDARADIWALGTVLYELLAGRPPFVAGSVPEVAIMIMSKEPAPLLSLRPDIPPALDQIVGKCLAKRPEDRYQDVGDLASALQAFATEPARDSIVRINRVLSKPTSDLAPPPPPTPPNPHVQTAGAWANTSTSTRSSASGLVIGVLAIAGAVVIAAVAVALVMARGYRTPKVDTTATVQLSPTEPSTATPSTSTPTLPPQTSAPSGSAAATPVPRTPASTSRRPPDHAAGDASKPAPKIADDEQFSDPH